MKTRLILDSKPNANGEYAIRINVTNGDSQTKISTGHCCAKKYFKATYDPMTGELMVVSAKSPRAKFINESVRAMLVRINTAAAELVAVGKLNSMSPTDFKKYVFGEKLKHVGNNKKVRKYYEIHEEYTKTIKNVRNAQLYDYALMRISSYCNIRELLVTDIDVVWLHKFQAWCARGKKNNGGASQAIRCIRTILSYACACKYMKLDDYPFGKGRFIIKENPPKKTVLSFEQLNAILSIKTIPGTIRETVIDLIRWMLSTGGMNTSDIFGYEPDPNSKYGMLRNVDGHLEYVRVKTRSKNAYPVQLKVTERMRYIMEKYKGEKNVFRFKEKYTNEQYRIWYNRIRTEMVRVGDILNIDDLTFNTIRHTWSTYAARKGVGVDQLSADMTMGHIPPGVNVKYYCVYDWENTYDAQDAVERYIEENVSAY